MPQSLNIARIGSQIKVDLEKIRDSIPQALAQKLTKDPRGTVKDYKMTDGGGIGLVLEFSDGSKGWFFEDELGRF